MLSYRAKKHKRLSSGELNLNPGLPQFVNCLTSGNTGHYVTVLFATMPVKVSVLGYQYPLIFLLLVTVNRQQTAGFCS